MIDCPFPELSVTLPDDGFILAEFGKRGMKLAMDNNRNVIVFASEDMASHGAEVLTRKNLGVFGYISTSLREFARDAGISSYVLLDSELHESVHWVG